MAEWAFMESIGVVTDWHGYSPTDPFLKECKSYIIAQLETILLVSILLIYGSVLKTTITKIEQEKEGVITSMEKRMERPV
jgi:hypothetical protein